jgi:thiosulfate/3-mercaptopyruvate sulfurtransferase
MTAMAYSTLISTAELASSFAAPNLVVVDCRFDLKDVSWGERAFAESRIPRSVYAHLDRDLSGAKDGQNGRHPLPDPATFVATLERLGISNSSQVVAYDQDTGSWASRLWWMLKWVGHDAVAVLNGGFARWTAEHRATESGDRRPSRGKFTPNVRHDMLVTIDDLAARQAEGMTLLDARAPERYLGQVEPLDRVPGHIPGAANRFYMDNLAPDGTFRPPSELASALSSATDNTPPDRVICYCGSGVTACHDILAMEHAGMHGAKLYAGSWSEYAADPTRPVATEEN